MPRSTPRVSPVDVPCGTQVKAPLGEGSRFWCFPLEERSLLHLPGAWWGPQGLSMGTKDKQQHQPQGLFHTQRFWFLLPPTQRKLQLTWFCPIQINIPKPFPGNYCDAKRFLCSSESLQHCFHPSIQRCSEFRSAPTEAVLGGFQSPSRDGGSVRRWMRLGRGKMGSQKQERPSTPLPFAFITLQTIYPVAPG